MLAIMGCSSLNSVDLQETPKYTVMMWERRGMAADDIV